MLLLPFSSPVSSRVTCWSAAVPPPGASRRPRGAGARASARLEVPGAFSGVMGQARWKHWEIIWDYMRYLWDIYEIFMGYLWDIYGIICQVMVIFFNGIQWRNQWDLRKKRWSNDFILDYMILYGGFQTLGCPRNHPVISRRHDLVLKPVTTGDPF